MRRQSESNHNDDCDTPADDSVNVAGSKTEVLKSAVSVTPTQPSSTKWWKVQRGNEKVSNHGSIPITIDCNAVAFIVSEEGFHQPIKRTKQSVFLDVTVFRHTLVD
ncbi:hypothetical protein TNCV_3512031 [Trichonephila clavipes]|nr:hypothetical protein TNCV_3512031 [Trichonephila clavipes]